MSESERRLYGGGRGRTVPTNPGRPSLTVHVLVEDVPRGPWRVGGRWFTFRDGAPVEMMRAAARWLLEEADRIEAGGSESGR